MQLRSYQLQQLSVARPSSLFLLWSTEWYIRAIQPSAEVSLNSCCLYHSELKSRTHSLPPVNAFVPWAWMHLCLYGHTFNTQQRALLQFWRCSKATCSLFRPLACSPRGTLVCWNAQMLWHRPWGGRWEDQQASVWCPDSTVTITSSAKNNKPTGMCFGVTDAETQQHRTECVCKCKHTVEGQQDVNTATLNNNLSSVRLTGCSL